MSPLAVFDLDDLKVFVDGQVSLCFSDQTKLLASLVFVPVNPRFDDWEICRYFQNVVNLDAPEGVCSFNWSRCGVYFMPQELDERYFLPETVFNILGRF